MKPEVVISLLFCFSIIFFLNCFFSSSMTRFKSAEYAGVNDSLVDINLFGTSVEPKNNGFNKDLLLLTGEGQAELISILSKRYVDNGSFFNAIKGDYFSSNGEPVADYLHKDLKMVFTIGRNRSYESFTSNKSCFSEADRIEFLKFSIQLDPKSNLKFVKWNRYSTEYDTLDIGDITFTKSYEAAGSAGGSISGISTSISGKSSASIQEQQNIRQRHMKLNGNINDSTIVIEEEGDREIDLAGNVIAEVAMQFKDTSQKLISVFSNLKSENDTGYHDPKDLDMRFINVSIPRFDTIPEQVTARLTMEYIYHHVISGYKTFSESDDKVNYYKGKISKQVVLFRKNDYSPQLWYIGVSDEAGTHRKTTIFAQNVTNKIDSRPLVFRSSNEA